jgi:hypothetical protein
VFRAINSGARRAAKKTQIKTEGFSIPLQPDTDLGLAMLIAEDDEGKHEPVAVVGTIAEARETAAEDLRSRMRSVEAGGHAGLCPTLYTLWARGINGAYRLACEITDPLE